MRALLLVTFAAGCLTPLDDDRIQWHEDFEACDGLCAWSTDGDVRHVSTYHPGEHAMSLAPHTKASHALAILRAAGGDDDDPYDPGNLTDGNWLEFSTDCVGPGALVLLRADGTGTRHELDVLLDDRDVGPFTRHRLSFPPLPPDVAVEFTAIHLRTRTLACLVDNLAVRIPGGV